MRFDRYRDRADDPLVLRQITDEIMFELRELSGQEYVNAYAKRKDDVTGVEEPTRVATVDGATVPVAVAS
jgi:1-acyl-sn-glycerol-3-phosphate acyltransferase